MTHPNIRLATEDDLRFVRKSWHRNFWKTWACKRVPWEAYWPGQEGRIAKLLSYSKVAVAYFPEVPDEVLGWACIQGDTLHYAYVKAAYRRSGIASGMTRGRVAWYSHATNEAGRAFMKNIGAQFNPYLVEQ